MLIYRRDQGIGNIVTVFFDVGDLVASAPCDANDGPGAVLIDGNDDRVGERLPRHPPPESTGMPPGRPRPARKPLHAAQVPWFRRPNDHDNAASHAAANSRHRLQRASKSACTRR